MKKGSTTTMTACRLPSWWGKRHEERVRRFVWRRRCINTMGTLKKRGWDTLPWRTRRHETMCCHNSRSGSWGNGQSPTYLCNTQLWIPGCTVLSIGEISRQTSVTISSSTFDLLLDISNSIRCDSDSSKVLLAEDLRKSKIAHIQYSKSS